MEGVELEARVTASENLDLIGNFSYQTSVTDDGDTQSLFSPEIMAKIGATYSGFKGITISMFNSYIGTSTDLNSTADVGTNTGPAINPTADAYNLLTANVIIDIAKMSGEGEPGISLFSIYLDNLLDENIFAPDLNFANENNTIPHHWGMGIYATYTHKFR